MSLVIFDFCETLVDMQTADPFVDFIKQKENHKTEPLINYFIRTCRIFKIQGLVNMLYPKFNFSKRLKALELKGLSSRNTEKNAKEYADILACSNLIGVVVEKLEWHKSMGDLIVIVSGGYKPYLKFFANKFGIHHVIASDLMISNSVFTGFLADKDCMHEQKIKYLEHYILQHKITFTESYVYTDSITDLPILLWADKGFVVSKSKEQNWAKPYGFNQIIY